MRTWRLAWILRTLRYRPCFHLLFMLAALCLACSDMTPEQMNTNVNCSSPERHTRSYTHLEGGDVRKTKLFCKTQWYLRIDKEGNVTGTVEPNNIYSILEIRTVGVGIVVIKGVESEYYLAMNKSGRIYTKKLTNEDCNFEEIILENNYNTYASVKWRNTGKRMFIAINNKGMPVKGKKSKKGQKASQFLPLRVSNNT